MTEEQKALVMKVAKGVAESIENSLSDYIERVYFEELSDVVDNELNQGLCALTPAEIDKLDDLDLREEVTELIHIEYPKVVAK